MSRLNNITSLAKSYFPAGLLLGIILGILLHGPVVASLVYINTPGFTSPDVLVEVSKVDTQFPEGTKVEKYGSIAWEDGYEIYRLSIRHQGGEKVENFKTQIRFPGGVKTQIFTQDRNGITPGEVETGPPVTPPHRFPVSANYKPEYSQIVVNSTKQGYGTLDVNIDALQDDDYITIEFLVDQEVSPCEELIAFNPQKESNFSYDWYKMGTRIEEEIPYSVENAEKDYKEAQKILNGSTNYRIVTFNKTKSYSSYIVLNKTGDKDSSLDCYLPYLKEKLKPKN